MQDVEDEPLFADRGADLDIAKAGVEAAIRVPSDTTAGRRQQETRAYRSTRAELEPLGDWDDGLAMVPELPSLPLPYRA